MAHLILSCDVHNWSLFYQTFRIIPGDVLHPHQITKKEMDSLPYLSWTSHKTVPITE